MATYATDKFIEQLRRVVLFGGGPGLTDASLLRRFAEERDNAAFEAIMRRHGPMVWGVCRRILSNSHDAEDAFQATFLVLVRKAASLRPRDMVGSWLYGVAHQTAIRTRALNAKRSGREKQVTTMPHPHAARSNTHHDLHDWLDQELGQLPDKYRAAIVLCDLEGKTRAEAARQLGWPQGTVSGRLARGRAMLAKRLAKHGPSLSVATLTAELANHAASASMPAALVSSTFKAAAMMAAGQTAAGVISTKVAALMEGVLKAMLITKLKTTMALILAVGLLAGVVGSFSGTTARIARAESQDVGVIERKNQTQLPMTKSATLIAIHDSQIHVKYRIELKPGPVDEFTRRVFGASVDQTLHERPNTKPSTPTADPEPGFGDNLRDFKIRQAFGQECEESKRLSKVYLASKGMVLAIDKYEIEKGRVKMTPFSMGLFAKSIGDQRFPEITTVQCSVAFLKFDRPITKLADLSGIKIVGIEFGQGDTVTIKNNRGTQELNDDLEMRVKDRPLYYEDARNLIWSDGAVELIDAQSQPELTRVTAIGLRVELSKDASPNRDKNVAAKKSSGVSIVDKITLLSKVDMYLLVDDVDLHPFAFMAGPDKLSKKQTAKVDPKKAHVHIQPNGDFVYDLVNKSVRFDDSAMIGYADLNVAKDAAIVQDGVAATLPDLKLGSRVTLTIDADNKNVVKIVADGGEMRGSLSMVYPSRNWIAFDTKDEPKVYQLLNETKILLANGKTGRIEDLKEGMNVLVIRSAKDGNKIIYVEVASPASPNGNGATPTAIDLVPKVGMKFARNPEKMFPDGRDHNFGTVDRGATVAHAFRVVNTTGKPIELTSVRVSCGCLSGAASTQLLKPNAEGRVEIALDTSRFLGAKTMSLLLAVKGAEATEEFRFTISANSQEEKKPAAKDERMNPERRRAFSMSDKPWNEVIEWLVDQSGLNYISLQPVPTGAFKFISPKGATYSLPEVIDIINDGLFRQQKLLIRRDTSFSIISIVEPIDPSYVPRVAIKDLGKRGKTEIVQVIVSLKFLDAKRFAPEAKKLMSPLGTVNSVSSKNQLLLQDTVASLSRAIDAINALDIEKAKK